MNFDHVSIEIRSAFTSKIPYKSYIRQENVNTLLWFYVSILVFNKVIIFICFYKD